MTDVHHSIVDLIGGTPLLELHRYRKALGLGARIVAKLEFLNPAGSIKDRTAWAIVEEAERSGALKPGSLICELTSGNTGIGLAAIAAARGYRLRIYSRDCISNDKISLLRHYGAEVILIPNIAFVQPNARQRIIDHILQQNPDAFFANQIGNSENPEVHFRTTGPEIWDDTNGKVDILVGAVGTGGTVSGTGRYLKSRNPAIKVAVVEPRHASLPSVENLYPDQIEGVHRISDIERDLLPGTYDAAVPDEFFELDTAQARAVVQEVSRTEGLFVGLSAASALWAASHLARRPENAGKLIVVIFADSGERYLAPVVTAQVAAVTEDLRGLLAPLGAV